MKKLQTMQPNGFGLVISAAIIWGTIGIATQAIYNADTTTSLFINLARMLVATPLLLIACWQIMGKKMFDIQPHDLRIMVLQGILLAISHAAYFTGIRYAGVTITTLLTVCASPLIVSSISVLLKLETFTTRMAIALILALLGSVLLVGLNTPAEAQQNLLFGTLFSMLAALSYAGSLICGRFLAKGYHPLQVTTISFSAGTVLLFFLNLLNGIVIVQTTQGWLLVLYLGLVPTALAYLLFQMGLRTVSATGASIITLIEPLVATVLAWVLFGEQLATTGVMGAMMLIVSIFLLSADKQDPVPTTE